MSYPLIPSADTTIYPHAVAQYHLQPKAKCDIVVLGVDKFSYPRKQPKCREFTQSENVWVELTY